MSKDLVGPVALRAHLAALFTRGSEFHKRMRGRVKRLVWATGLPNHRREDLFQMLAVEMLKALPKFDPTRATLEVFLAGVMRNWYRWQLRKILDQGEAEPMGDLWDDGEGAEAAWDRERTSAIVLADLQEDMEGLLDRMPKDLREFAVLLARHSPQDIVKITGKDRTTIWRKIQRLRKWAEKNAPHFRNGKP